MTEHPTASWEAMPDGNVFYRRQQLYSIPGKLPNLGDYIVAGCRFGGPIGACLAPLLYSKPDHGS
jgi:vacuolar protein sorting-associated protein 16